MARLGSTTTARARQMRRVLRRWERSGLTLKAFGERERLAPSTLVWWRHVFRHARAQRGVQRPATEANTRRAPAPPSFVERTAEVASLGVAGAVEIFLRSGHVLRVRASVDAVALRTVVSVLEGGC